VPRRSSEHQRGRIIALARSQPPGRLVQGGEGLQAPADPHAPATWTLDTLAQAACAEGIRVGRSQVRRILSQVRRILQAERMRWRRTRSWTQSPDPDLAPKRARVIALYTAPPPETTVICADELGPVIPRSFPPAPGWTADGHRVKALLDYGRGPEKTWVYGALRSVTATRSPWPQPRATRSATSGSWPRSRPPTPAGRSW
jgi:hypothetical protein